MVVSPHRTKTPTAPTIYVSTPIPPTLWAHLSERGMGGWRVIGFGPLVGLAAVVHPAFCIISPSLLEISSSRDML